LAGTVFARSAKNDLVGLDHIKDLTEQLTNEWDAIYDPEFDAEEFDRIMVINDMIKTLMLIYLQEASCRHATVFSIARSTNVMKTRVAVQLIKKI